MQKSKSPVAMTGLSACFYWCRLQDSNPPPDDYKSPALPDELSRRNWTTLMVNHLVRPCFNLEQAAFIVGSVQEPVSGLIVSLA
jgi:hypothetical protein